jgi:hypothetical protein
MKTIAPGTRVEAVVIRRNLLSGGETRGVAMEKQEGDLSGQMQRIRIKDRRRPQAASRWACASLVQLDIGEAGTYLARLPVSLVR